MLFRLRHPLATNPRVKNLFERAPLGRVRKQLSSEVSFDSSPHLAKRPHRQTDRGFPVSPPEALGVNELPESASKNFAAGTISHRQSQNVLLPVEIPPVIPIAGMAPGSPRGDAFSKINVKRLFHLRCAES